MKQFNLLVDKIKQQEKMLEDYIQKVNAFVKPENKVRPESWRKNKKKKYVIHR